MWEISLWEKHDVTSVQLAVVALRGLQIDLAFTYMCPALMWAQLETKFSLIHLMAEGSC